MWAATILNENKFRGFWQEYLKENIRTEEEENRFRSKDQWWIKRITRRNQHGRNNEKQNNIGWERMEERKDFCGKK